jgi:hypothetical protein
MNEPSDPAPVAVDGYWRLLVTAALLGTDRHAPPFAGVGALDDLVADAVRPDDASRMLAAVAATAAARRAAFLPMVSSTVLQPPLFDDRPLHSSAVAATWRAIVAEWPVLEDEWMLTVIRHGFRLAPDVLTAALLRHRSDAVRRARVAVAGGPLSTWLTDHLPSLGGLGAKPAPAELVAELPELAIPPELSALLAADAHTFVERLLAGFAPGGFGAAHRPVLVNLLARCRPAVLDDAAAALTASATGLGLALADLCRLRARMLAELPPVSRNR